MTINGRSNLATDPIRNFRFLVTFLPHSGTNDVGFKPTVGFTSVSGLSVTTESIPYREGGYNTSVHQIPGQTSFSPLTMQRGVVLGTRQNWDWMRALYRTVNASNVAGSNRVGGAQGRGASKDFRCDLEIAVLDHPQAGSAAGNTGYENAAAANDNVALRFKVYNAWPTSLAFSDLNAGDNALMVEQMTLVHEGFDTQWASGPDKTAPKFAY